MHAEQARQSAAHHTSTATSRHSSTAIPGLKALSKIVCAGRRPAGSAAAVACGLGRKAAESAGGQPSVAAAVAHPAQGVARPSVWFIERRALQRVCTSICRYNGKRMAANLCINNATAKTTENLALIPCRTCEQERVQKNEHELATLQAQLQQLELQQVRHLWHTRQHLKETRFTSSSSERCHCSATAAATGHACSVSRKAA